MTTLTPDDLLIEAQRMLDEASTATVAVWPRAVALLARQAVEDALRRYWAEHAPGVERLTMRAQLACLRAYLPSADLARDVTFTWHALSRATHHHAYELDPTREELSSLVAAARRLVAAVDGGVRPAGRDRAMSLGHGAEDSDELSSQRAWKLPAP